MNKQISKVVIYYADGTYQEVGTGWYGQGIGIAPAQRVDPPFGEDVWKTPGEAGKWPFPPDDIGTKIVD
jgi:hypothetical protein